MTETDNEGIRIEELERAENLNNITLLLQKLEIRVMKEKSTERTGNNTNY